MAAQIREMTAKLGSAELECERAVRKCRQLQSVLDHERQLARERVAAGHAGPAAPGSAEAVRDSTEARAAVPASTVAASGPAAADKVDEAKKSDLEQLRHLSERRLAEIEALREERIKDRREIEVLRQKVRAPYEPLPSRRARPTDTVTHGTAGVPDSGAGCAAVAALLARAGAV